MEEYVLVNKQEFLNPLYFSTTEGAHTFGWKQVGETYVVLSCSLGGLEISLLQFDNP